MPLNAAIPAPVVYSTGTRRIMDMPEFPKIIAQLKAGASVPSLVSWFEKEGWLGELSPSTFNQYLYKFKAERPDLLAGKPLETESYDAYVGTTIPDNDPIVEINKLILVQKRRISIDFNTEITIGKLLDNTHKEVKVLGELLSIKMQMNGEHDLNKINSTDVSSQLRNLRVDESAQDKMQELAGQLFAGIKANANKAQKKKIKLKA